MTFDNHFAVAHLLGHSAFRHLALALKVYREAQDAGLFKLDAYSWQKSLRACSDLEHWREEEVRSCVQAVVLFQAMMEKIPFFLPGFGKGLVAPTASGFESTWKKLLEQIKNDDEKRQAQHDFNAYNASVYKKMRNPIIHGRQPADITLFNEIRATAVHEGFRSGWAAFDALLRAVSRMVSTVPLGRPCAT